MKNSRKIQIAESHESLKDENGRNILNSMKMEIRTNNKRRRHKKKDY